MSFMLTVGVKSSCFNHAATSCGVLFMCDCPSSCSEEWKHVPRNRSV